MKLYDAQNLGLVQRIWKRTSSDIISYPLKEIVSDINGALDWYFTNAFKASLGWEFDDSNQTSPPIDTQNLVSGTNRYKLSAFTEKIVNLVKLEVLNSAGIGQPLIAETFDTLGTPLIGAQSGNLGYTNGQTFQQLYLSSTNNSGTPTHYCKYGDFIYLRPFPNYSLSSALKVYFNRPASKFNFVSCSISNASPAIVSATAHGLTTGDTIMFETQGTLNTGITADTVYYVISTGLTADQFEFSLTSGGSAVNTSSTGSNNYFIKLNGSPGFQETHHEHLVTYTSKLRLNDSNLNLLGTLPTDVLLAEQKILADYTLKSKDITPRLSVRYEDNR